MHAGLRLLDRYERRRLYDGGQRRERELAQRALRQQARRHRHAALVEPELHFAEIAHLDLDAVDPRYQLGQLSLDAAEEVGFGLLRGVEERGEFFPCRSDAPHFLQGAGRAHPFPRLEVEEQPALQFGPRRGEMGVVRRIVRHRQDAVVQEAVVVRDLRPAFMRLVELVAPTLEEGLPPARQLALAVQGGQVLVGDAQSARPRLHLDRDAVPQVSCAHATGLPA